LAAKRAREVLGRLTGRHEHDDEAREEVAPLGPGPLAGIKVVELGVWIAGPATGGLLADWGADVVKLEGRDGDPARRFMNMFGGEIPFNPPFELDNRSKRSIVIDLGNPVGLAVAHELIEDADVFLTNVRLDALERLGLDPDTLMARYPRLVYCAVTGFGVTGPERDRAAYDIGAFWARSGVASLLTAPDGAPPFQRGGMGDHGAGMSGAAAVCAALVSRGRTGKGQLVSTSLLRHGAYTVGFDVNISVRLGLPVAIGTHSTMGNPLINWYQDRDGRYFWLIGLEGDRHWPDLCRAIGRPEWIEDERFDTMMTRRDHCRDLIGLLDEIFAARTREEWGVEFDRENVWWAPVQTVDELLADEQFLASGGLVEVPDGPSTATMVASPVDFAGTPWAPRAMPPGLGEHTDEILAELGRDQAAIDHLRADGVVG
jgi:crotonobetainyl-CoA:carnitine CoA-transferase CaiB-like acyl-CoA transferase